MNVLYNLIFIISGILLFIFIFIIFIINYDKFLRGKKMDKRELIIENRKLIKTIRTLKHTINRWKNE